MSVYNVLQAQRFMNNLYPNEEHGLEGDCLNPKCNYTFSDEDWKEIQRDGGWFTCPRCGWTYNYLDDLNPAGTPGGYTRAGITMKQMGNIGESLVIRMGDIPAVGQVIKYYGEEVYHNPIDAQIGIYGVEIKTIHSEAQPRFKLTGGGTNRTRAEAIQSAISFCQQNNLDPALIGVRLNFYTSKADIFFRRGLADTWIGSANLLHISTEDFSDLNPFPDPTEVPPPSDLPQDDDTPAQEDIPF